MHILKLVPVLMIATLVTACGDKPNPAGPSPPTPAVASLVISGADYTLTDSTTTYTATATLSDGSMRTVTPSWSSSAVNVAAVDNAGRLDGRAHGSTTLTATYEGRSVSKTVQVVNNYGGRWSGRYNVTACKDSGIFTDGIGGTDVPWCQGRTGISKQTLLTPFTVVQTGMNYSEIRATFDQACDAFFGSGTISGGVTADGRLHLEGTLKLLNWYCDPVMDLQLSGWDTNLEGAGSMTGRWTQDLTIIGREGSAQEEVELVTMLRTATASASQ